MATHDLSKLRVLLVEDDAFTQQLHRSMVRKLGIVEIHVCSDGEEALKLLTTKEYDVVLVDWQLPTRDGHSLVKAVRGLQDKDRAGVPVIMVTGAGDKTRVVKAREAGVDGYIVKPVSVKAIQDRITALIDRGRLDLSKAGGSDVATDNTGTAGASPEPPVIPPSAAE